MLRRRVFKTCAYLANVFYHQLSLRYVLLQHNTPALRTKISDRNGGAPAPPKRSIAALAAIRARAGRAFYIDAPIQARVSAALSNGEAGLSLGDGSNRGTGAAECVATDSARCLLLIKLLTLAHSLILSRLPHPQSVHQETISPVQIAGQRNERSRYRDCSTLAEQILHCMHEQTKSIVRRVIGQSQCKGLLTRCDTVFVVQIIRDAKR